MFKKIGKIVCLSLAVLAFLFFAGLLSLKSYPQFGFWLAGKTTGYQISAASTDISLWPLSVEINELSVVKSAGQPFVNLDQVNFDADWFNAIRGRNNFWSTEIHGGTINLLQDNGQLDADQENLAASAQNEEQLDVHALLSTLRCKISDVRVIVDQDIYLHFAQLNTTLNQLDLSDHRQVTQNIDFELIYGSEQHAIEIGGIVKSSQSADATQLELMFAPLDLSALLPDSDTQETPSSVEPALDWSWLQGIKPIHLSGNVEQIIIGPNELSQLSIDVVLDHEININSLDSKVKWQLSDQHIFDDQISVRGSLKPIASITTAGDLIAELNFVTNSAEVNLKGAINVNGITGNDLNADLTLSGLPIKFAEGVDSAADVELADQYLPLTLSTQLKTSETSYEVKQLHLVAGQSDLTANINIAAAAGEIVAISAALKSSLIHYQAPTVAESGADKEALANTSEAAAAGQKTALFSEERLSWDWLNNLQIDSTLAIEELKYDEYQLSNIDLPIKLADGKLLIENFVAGFSKGVLKGSFSLQEKKAIANSVAEDSLDVILSLSLKDAQLEAANLLPPDQLTGGNTNVSLDIATSGASVKTLASSLAGNLLMEVSEAEVTSSSFNLIGSDLLMEMINTLNPFAASDPVTKISCAVIHADFAGGKVDFADSLAIETDKMAIVGDGELDLLREQIDLSFNPRAQSGLGVNVGTLVKFMKLGGHLTDPKPVVSASGLLKTGVAIGVAMSTGGVSLLADGLLNKVPAGAACKKAKNAFNRESAE